MDIRFSKSKPLKLSLSKFADLLEKVDTQRELAIATIFNYGSRIKEDFITSDQPFRILL